MRKSILIGLMLLSTSSYATSFERLAKDNVQYQHLAKSIAALVHNDRLEFGNEGIELKYQTLEAKGFCSDSKFSREKSLSRCTGSLISDRHILTAGHCATLDNFCEAHSWIFDYQLDLNGISPNKLNTNQVYKCAKLTKMSYAGVQENQSAVLVGDYAIVELDRPVTGREPLKLINQKSVEIGEKVFSIHHALGMPQSISQDGVVTEGRRGERSLFFTSNLETYNGSSGAPIFNEKEQIVGIVAKGDEVIRINEVKKCKEVIDVYKEFTREQLEKLTDSTQLKPILKTIKKEKIPASIIDV